MSEACEEKTPSMLDQLKNFNLLANSTSGSLPIDNWLNSFDYWNHYRSKSYTIEEVIQIIESGSVQSKRLLSVNYLAQNSFYQQFISHYVSLLKYSGLLIPNPTGGRNLQEKSLQKKYYKALDCIDGSKIPALCRRIAFITLRDGRYFGIVQKIDTKGLVLLDLPYDYCRTTTKDAEGRAIVEFNVNYFTKLSETDRRAAFKVFPKNVATYWKRYAKRTGEVWMPLPTSQAVTFSLLGETPFFLAAIPSTLQYEEALLKDMMKLEEEVKKILVQEIPHLNDGTLLFEPPEAAEIHSGTVKMMGTKNPNVSVLTSYGKVSSIGTNTSDSLGSSVVENTRSHIYSLAGISGEVFGASGSSSLNTSIKYDINIMMILAEQIGNFITDVLNEHFGDASISFKYLFLPTTLYNEVELTDSYLKTAAAGSPYLLVAAAQGLSQKDFFNLKNLENKVLKMDELLNKEDGKAKETSDPSEQSGGAQQGRPPLKPEEKTAKTIANEDSKNKTGG